MSTVFVLDEPNMNVALKELRREGEAHQGLSRPAVMRWLKTKYPTMQLHACIFFNIRPGSELDAQNRIDRIQRAGFICCAKRKSSDLKGDIDSNMIEFIDEHRTGMTDLIIGSHDAKNFKELVERLISEGVHVTILGFVEKMIGWRGVAELDIVDIESIPQAFKTKLDRSPNVWSATEAGTYFAPKPTASTPPANQPAPARRRPMPTPRSEAPHPHADKSGKELQSVLNSELTPAQRLLKRGYKEEQTRLRQEQDASAARPPLSIVRSPAS